jgi:hypothetical protein
LSIQTITKHLTMIKKILRPAFAGLFLVTFTFGALNAQYKRCASHEVYERMLKEDPQFAANRARIERETREWIEKNGNNKLGAVITIPVVFHVVYNTSAQNIPDARIIEQLNVLNQDFGRTNADAVNTPSVWQGIAANTNIQFCLAQRDPSGNPTNGIVRKSTTVTSFSTNDNIKRSANGGSDAWPRDQYLNIWVGNLSGGLLGYAQFPGGAAATDGVVVLYSSVGGPNNPGTATPYHLGRTATHEVGHWLNLYHIWGDDGTGCSGSDQVSDTPNQAGATSGCPTFPKTDACTSTSPGIMFMNYMDYSYDACMNMFTNGQSSRMNATLNGTRLSLQSSPGCTPASGGTCGIPTSLSATSVTSSSATLNWSAVSGATSYNVRYKATASSTWINNSTSSTSLAVSGLSASTSYEFQVQAVCGANSSAYSSSATFTTQAAGCSDVYESNNTLSAAKTIPVNTDIYGLISPSGDNDYFKFTTTSPNTYIRIDLSNLPADYDIRLYNSSGSQLAISQNGGTAAEVIIRNTSSAATYYVRVYGYNGANNASQCYLLRINTKNSAWREAEWQVNNEVVVFPNPAMDKVHIQFSSPKSEDVTIRLADITGRIVQSLTMTTEAGLNTAALEVMQLPKGIYLLELVNTEGRTVKRFVKE